MDADVAESQKPADVPPPRPEESGNADVDAMIADLFDNEVVWDADDTDEFLFKLFRDLEASGAKITAVTDLGRNSLLHMAALWNRRVVMEEIVRRGADLNAKNRNGHTPLDLATHWGHFELALQLQHYGGKHTCEHERDIAVSQRDLAQQRYAECEAETHDALQRLKHAKQEREEFRIERDRLVELHSEVTRLCNAQADRLELMDAAVRELTAEKHALRITAAQLTDELKCEQAARNNAVQGWRIAENVVTDLQRLHVECREREEEAVAMRNEALEERDVAREMARQAQIDQGVAKQHQANADRERDNAVNKLLDAESDIARDKERWSVKLARVELERRNIQVEIDRQTELLRCENVRLEKQLDVLAVANARQRQEIEEASTALVDLQKQFVIQQRELASATASVSKLEEQVRVLMDERRDEHRAWRQRMLESLQLALASELRTLLEAVVVSWRKLHECQELVYAYDLASLSALFRVPSSDGSAVATSAAASGVGEETSTGMPRQGSATTASAPSLRTVLLPAIQDKSVTLVGVKDGSLTPRAQSAVGNNNVSSSFVSHNYDLSLRFAHDPRVQSRLREAEAALQQQQQLLSDPPNLRSVADHVTAHCSSLASYLDALTQYALKHLAHFRTQALAQDKMIERKDELLQRFTQHRMDKPKKTRPARFRDCFVRPSV